MSLLTRIFEVSDEGLITTVPFVGAFKWFPAYMAARSGGVAGLKERRYIVGSMKSKRTLKVAQMVCEAFHGPMPEGKPYVLHRDEDARNNRPDNLYWGTQKENLNAPGFITYCKSRVGENSTYAKARK